MESIDVIRLHCSVIGQFDLAKSKPKFTCGTILSRTLMIITVLCITYTNAQYIT